MNKLMDNTTDKFAKAFIAVCEMIEPNVCFTDLNHTTHICNHGTDISIEVTIEVSGHLDEDTIVIVTRETSNIVVRYYHMGDTTDLLKERKIWYFSFNWKGLMMSI